MKSSLKSNSIEWLKEIIADIGELGLPDPKSRQYAASREFCREIFGDKFISCIDKKIGEKDYRFDVDKGQFNDYRSNITPIGGIQFKNDDYLESEIPVQLSRASSWAKQLVEFPKQNGGPDLYAITGDDLIMNRAFKMNEFKSSKFLYDSDGNPRRLSDILTHRCDGDDIILEGSDRTVYMKVIANSSNAHLGVFGPKNMEFGEVLELARDNGDRLIVSVEGSKYGRLAEIFLDRYFKENKLDMKYQIVSRDGKLEAWIDPMRPQDGYGHIGIDIIETGDTINSNGLKEYENIGYVNQVLARSHTNSNKSYEKEINDTKAQYAVGAYLPSDLNLATITARA